MTLLSDEIRYDLINWSRWLNSGQLPHPLPSDHAGSAEGNWRPPSDLGDADADNLPPPPRPMIDVERAERVDRIFHKRLTALQRRVLAAEFPRRSDFMIELGAGDSAKWIFDRAAAIRHCKTSARNYREALRQGAILIGEELERQEEVA